MKLTCIQMDMVLGAPDANFARAEALVRRTAEERPDVIVLPETWNTGFFPEDLAAAADVDGARTKSVFGPLARELGVNIVCGSTAVRRGEAFYNAAHIFDRSGALIAEYDKTHLFSPSGEDAHFRAGDKLCLFELDGRPCGLIICYDLRFPELARTLALKGAEMLFVVSQWPEARVMHLEALSRARAIENQMFVCLCNSAASDTRCGGHSALIAPDGTYLAHAGAGEALLTGEADFSVIDGIRSSINVFRDRRAGLYRLDEHPRGAGNAPAGADIIRPCGIVRVQIPGGIHRIGGNTHDIHHPLSLRPGGPGGGRGAPPGPRGRAARDRTGPLHRHGGGHPPAEHRPAVRRAGAHRACRRSRPEL